MAVSRERYGPLVHRSVHHGATLWIVGVLQFLVAMIVTQFGWSNPSYSLSQNYISDLGAVDCGEFARRNICSPWHVVFNGSIILMGVLLILGILLLPSAFPNRRSRALGLGLLALAGLGAIGVGTFPEDVNLTAHTISALLAFAGGGFALIVLGVAMFRDTRWDGYRAYSLLSGLVTLVALALFSSHSWQWGGLWADLGAGGIERLIVAPVLLWALLAGIHLLRIPAFAPRQIPKTTAT
ncbi:MAG: DUF998 domain-containing protein [Thermoplasmata archaeon]|jgi:hypothetical membrane protein